MVMYILTEIGRILKEDFVGDCYSRLRKPEAEGRRFWCCANIPPHYSISHTISICKLIVSSDYTPERV